MSGHHRSTLVIDGLVPESGQVVRCRDRLWAVNAVTPSSLPAEAKAERHPDFWRGHYTAPFYRPDREVEMTRVCHDFESRLAATPTPTPTPTPTET